MPRQTDPRQPTGPRRLAGALLAAVAVLAGGCGLSEYEERMAAEQERIKFLDDDAVYLEKDALLWTTRTDSSGGTLPGIYLRAPKGTYQKPDERSPGAGVVQYSGAGTCQFQAIYLATAMGRRKEDFIRDVLAPLGATAFGTTKIEKEAQGRPPLKLETRQFERATSQGRSVCHAFFSFDDAGQAAVVFQADKNRPAPEIDKAIDLSLRTLSVRPGTPAKSAPSKSGTPGKS